MCSRLWNQLIISFQKISLYKLYSVLIIVFFNYWYPMHFFFFIYCFLLTGSLPSVPVPEPSARPPPNRRPPPPSLTSGPPSGDSSRGATWFRVAWGLEMTVEFFMFSAVVTGACLLCFPPNNLWKRKNKGPVSKIKPQKHFQQNKIWLFVWIWWKRVCEGERRQG